MEVEGKKILEKYCLLCKNHGKDTQANGYCDNCEQYMCNTCFKHHKMLKVAREHNFIDNENGAIGEATTDNRDELDVCPEHDESIKFYCPSHDVVGCGDCMILGHKPCSVEYVREKAKVLQGSDDYICFVKELSQCNEKVHDIESVLNSNNEKVTDINNTFVASVNMYKDEIVSQVNKVAAKIIIEAANVASENRQGMNDIERESKSLSSNITTVQQVLDAHTDQPSKLFVSFIQQKPKLKCIKKELDEIECKNKIDHYHFEPESEVMSVLTGCSGIGRLQRVEGSNRRSDTLENNEGAASREQLTLTGHEFCEYEPVNVDHLKLFIRNIAESTSSECITLFLSSISGTEPSAVIFGETPGTAMLCFETPPDVSNIRKLCERRQCEGNNWIISVVERTRMVKVTCVHLATIDTATLEFYFENKRRSQGGDVESIECQEKDCIITFVYAEDAERVCSRHQRAEGRDLTVVLHYPCLTPDKDLTVLIPPPILLNNLDNFTSKFIQRSSKYKVDLESKLRSHYGMVFWPSAENRNNFIQIVCSVDPKDKNGLAKVKDWTEKCLSDVKEITDGLTLERTKKVTEEVWAELIPQIEDMNVSNPEVVAIFVGKGNCSLIIAGETIHVLNLLKKFHEIITDIEKKRLPASLPYGKPNLSNPRYGQAIPLNPRYGQANPPYTRHGKSNLSNPRYGQATRPDPGYGQGYQPNQLNKQT